MQEAIYIHEDLYIEEALIFSIRLSTTTTEKQRFEFNSELGKFAVHAKQMEGKYQFKIDTTESDFLTLSQFKQSSITTASKHGIQEPLVSPFVYRYFGGYDVGKPI